MKVIWGQFHKIYLNYQSTKLGWNRVFHSNPLGDNELKTQSATNYPINKHQVVEMVSCALTIWCRDKNTPEENGKSRDSDVLVLTSPGHQKPRHYIMTSSNGNISASLAFVRGIHRWPVNSPHKGQWRAAFMFSLICAWMKGWENNREAGDLRRHRTHYDVIVMV